MSRSLWVVVLLGLGGVLALGQAMRHFVAVAGPDRRIVQAVSSVYGDRLAAPSRLQLVEAAGGRYATLTVFPAAGVPTKLLAHDIGSFLWYRLGEADPVVAVEVVCQPVGQPSSRYTVPKPRMPSPPSRTAFPEGAPPATGSPVRPATPGK